MLGRNAPYEQICKRTQYLPQYLAADSSGLWPEQAEKFGRSGEPVFSLPLQRDQIDPFVECSRTGVHKRQKIVSLAGAGGRATKIEIALTGRGWDTKTPDREKLTRLSQLHQ